MRHIIYSTYKDILHEMEDLTSSDSYEELISIVTHYIRKRTMPENLNLVGYKSLEKTIDELGIDKEDNPTINNSFYYEKMYQDMRKSIEETIDELGIDKEEISTKAISEYTNKLYTKKRKDHINIEVEKTLKALDNIGFIAIFDLIVKMGA